MTRTCAWWETQFKNWMSKIEPFKMVTYEQRYEGFGGLMENWENPVPKTGD